MLKIAATIHSSNLKIAVVEAEVVQPGNLKGEFSKASVCTIVGVVRTDYFGVRIKLSARFQCYVRGSCAGIGTLSAYFISLSQ